MKIPMKLKRTKRFNGKLYRLADWYFSRAVVKASRDTLRMRGYFARVTTIKEGPTGRSIYLLWFRPMGKPPIRLRRR